MRGSTFLMAVLSCASLSLATWDHNLDGFGSDTAARSISPYNSVGIAVEAVDYGILAKGGTAAIRVEGPTGGLAELGSNLGSVWAAGDNVGPAIVAYGYGSTGIFTMGSTAIEAYGSILGIKGEGYGTSAVGVYGSGFLDYSIGVKGTSSSSQYGTGVYGEVLGATPTGILGNVSSNASSDLAIGVRGVSNVTGTYSYGIGVDGEASAGTGATFLKGVNAYAWGGGSANWGVYTNAYGGESGPAIGIYATASDAGGNTAGIFDGDVVVNGSCSCYPSDQKLKKNIEPLNLGLAAVMAMQPKTYDMKVEEYKGKMNLAKGHQVGLIAQDVEKIVPQAVTEVKIPAREQKGKDGKTVKIDAVDYKSLNYVALIPVLIKAIQEQEAKIEALEKKLAAK